MFLPNITHICYVIYINVTQVVYKCKLPYLYVIQFMYKCKVIYIHIVQVMYPWTIKITDIQAEHKYKVIYNQVHLARNKI